MREMEKMLVPTKFFFSNSVSKRLVLQTGKSEGLFETGSSKNFLIPGDFSLSPLMHVRKEVNGFGKNNCISNSVKKPGNR